MNHLPQKRETSIDGQRLAYSLSGEGKPAIVLINGAGGPLAGWYRLYPEIERLGTVIAFDRPGAGDSPRATRPQTGRMIIALLRGLLRQLDVQPPYILVAHSFGGLHANLFARLHPAEVAGVVFVEATAPDDVSAMKQHQSPLQRAINGFFGAFSRPDPNGEIENESRTVEEINAAPAFPAAPVIVLSGARTPPRWMMSPAALEMRDLNQRRLSEMSPRGERVLAYRSGHFPQMSEPELVLAAIQRLAAQRS